MGAQIISLSKAIPLRSIPGADQCEQMNSEQTLGIGADFRFATRELISEFVSLLKRNPKVWAVAANGDQGGIDIWTLIDSTDRHDREAVYDVEWELMTRYPEVAFDFSTILAPARSVSFERGRYTYVYNTR